MGSEFFKAGGFGMYPTLLFGFLLVATAALFLLRGDRRAWPMMASLGATTFCAGLLGVCMGLMNTFRYLDQVTPAEKFNVAAAGTEESLHNLVLALILMVLAGLLASVGSFRHRRALASGNPIG